MVSSLHAIKVNCVLPCISYLGGVVLMALDQRAVNEQVDFTDSLKHLDSFLAGFFRDGGGDAGPVISTAVTERCEISITRPKTIPGVCRMPKVCITRIGNNATSASDPGCAAKGCKWSYTIFSPNNAHHARG